jgi:hypothetical protein
MKIDAQALRQQADHVSQETLLRRRAMLRALSPAERLAVERAARAVGQGVAGCLLQAAVTDAHLAAVLAALYPSVGKAATQG